jgi:hypothetical protein
LFYPPIVHKIKLVNLRLRGACGKGGFRAKNHPCNPKVAAKGRFPLHSLNPDLTRDLRAYALLSLQQAGIGIQIIPLPVLGVLRQAQDKIRSKRYLVAEALAKAGSNHYYLKIQLKKLSLLEK